MILHRQVLQRQEEMRDLTLPPTPCQSSLNPFRVQLPLTGQYPRSSFHIKMQTLGSVLGSARSPLAFLPL
jgi:hypothetical protein